MTTTDQQITVTNVEYHRNGVSGEGFYAINLTTPEHGEMIAVAFDLSVEAEDQSQVDGSWINPAIAVFKVDLLPDLTFGTNSWRGDHYWPAVYAAIKEHQAR